MQALGIERRGTSLQMSAQAVHTLGTGRSACLPVDIIGLLWSGTREGPVNLDARAAQARNVSALERSNHFCYYRSAFLY